LKVTETDVAAETLALPACDAVIVHEPAESKFTVVPDMVQTDRVVLEEYDTFKPATDVDPLRVRVPVLSAVSAICAKVIV